MAADLNDVDFFNITGNLGADGYGSNQGGILNVAFGNTNYKGFYTSTFSTFDPTINHLIIVEDDSNLNHAFLTNTSNEDHDLSGLNNTTRIYYLLFAGNASTPMPVQSIQSILETFVEEFTNGASFGDNFSYELESGESVMVEMYIPVSGLEAGSYEFPIQISTNIPGNGLVTVPVTVEVDNAPCSFFQAFVDNSSCNGIVEFENQSTNSPESITWNFGDATTSTDASPLHVYALPGSYTVILTVCSDGECNSSEQIVEVISAGGPIPAICDPFVTNIYSNMYFEEVAMNGNSNSELQSTTGYVDLSCEIFAEIIAGIETPFTISYFSDITSQLKAQIDFNNDGIFSNSEIIYFDNGSANSTFTAPAESVLDTPLRFRLMIDQYNLNDCVLFSGRVLDFSVVIVPLSQAPETAFNWVALDECQRVYQFMDNSTNLPNSWSWNFGDGSSSSVQNPIHIYDEAGDYNITLAAGNIYGTNSYNANLVSPLSGISSLDITGNSAAGEEISFSAIFDGSGDLTWDFGDGELLETNLTTVQHIYAAPGIYEISVSTSADVCNTEVSIFLNVLAVGVNDGAEARGFLIYPNPSNGDLTIECPEGVSLVEIALFDAVGKKIEVIGGSTTDRLIKLRIEDPVAGMYFLQLMNSDGEIFRSRVILE